MTQQLPPGIFVIDNPATPRRQVTISFVKKLTGEPVLTESAAEDPVRIFTMYNNRTDKQVAQWAEPLPCPNS